MSTEGPRRLACDGHSDRRWGHLGVFEGTSGGAAGDRRLTSGRLFDRRRECYCSRYYYDAESWEIFLHWSECIRAGNPPNWPEPPEVVRKLTEAKDVAQAIEKVRGGGWNSLVYDEETLITTRTLKPRPLVSRYDPKVGKHVPIDPYEYDGPEDLSE